MSQVTGSWAPVSRAVFHSPLQHVVWRFGSPLASRGPCVPHSSHWRCKVIRNQCLHGEGALLPSWVLQVIVLLGFIYVHLFFPSHIGHNVILVPLSFSAVSPWPLKNTIWCPHSGGDLPFPHAPSLYPPPTPSISLCGMWRAIVNSSA